MGLQVFGPPWSKLSRTRQAPGAFTFLPRPRQEPASNTEHLCHLFAISSHPTGSILLEILQPAWKCPGWDTPGVLSLSPPSMAAPDSAPLRANPRFSRAPPLPLQLPQAWPTEQRDLIQPLKRFQARCKLPRTSLHSSISITLGYMFCWLNYLNRNT